ncbi:phosphotransferase enzyme family protein [Microdochium trichocladiopsis]|uniref:Phosphotransferase enzyme family protein n=1 Tax=Microdochium trichocladiopsis TaxID=1682393 RepID=A0A9P8Y0U6_9PEZI|nr:phosphotransferase enzyme family protein [Microdochium trichocladiopsis]KAH7026643.1 phosphotransferase enzyme family protein [Microdochium trichocladiopsis]
MLRRPSRVLDLLLSAGFSLSGSEPSAACHATYAVTHVSPGHMEVFPDSSFFKERRASTLPSPASIRAANVASGHLRASYFVRPPPVIFPSLGLFVKYGANVRIAEAYTQRMLAERLSGIVPVPEVFAWTEDQGQGFIYMQLIDGQPLQDKWPGMSDTERRSVCSELKTMVSAWRGLTQDGEEPFIGSIGERPLNDIFLEHRPELTGPFKGINAVQSFQEACNIAISPPSPIVFTHADLVAVNIILSHGANPKVAAVIDWEQSGWYPAYWEYCKAHHIRLRSTDFSDVLQDEWQEKYLPMILDPVDDASCYHPWIYFVMTKGI